jgi:hypothetical protein
MVLEFIKSLMEELDLPYELMEYTQNPVPNPYFVGEYQEVPPTELEENGNLETSFIITGTGETFGKLEEAKNKIRDTLPRRQVAEEGGLVVFYNGSLYVPTGDAELKRIQINLDIEEWRS